MKEKKLGKAMMFFFNAALLTVTSLIIRTVGVAFNVYVTGKLGASGVGLLSPDYLSIWFFYNFCTLRCKSGRITHSSGRPRT